MTDFDTHHIGVQQPHAPTQDETDTHLHNQPAPDITSDQPVLNFTATQDADHLSSSSHQLPTQLAVNTAAEHQPAVQSAQPQPGDSEASSSHGGQQYDQAGTAVFLDSQTGQVPGATGQSASPAADQQSEETSISAQQAAEMYHQHHPSGAASSAGTSSSTQPSHQQQQQQLAINASAETPSYTQLHPDGTPYTAHVSTSDLHQQAGTSHGSQSLVEQQQQAEVSQDATPRADQQLLQAGTSERAQAPSDQQPAEPAKPLSRDGQAPLSQQEQHEPGQSQEAAAAIAQQQAQPAGTKADLSDSQSASEQQPEGDAAASDAVVNADKVTETAISTDVQQGQSDTQDKGRGAGYPAGPLGELGIDS